MEALLAGACGYLVKDAAVSEIVRGVRAAAREDRIAEVDRRAQPAGGRQLGERTGARVGRCGAAREQ